MSGVVSASQYSSIVEDARRILNEPIQEVGRGSSAPKDFFLTDRVAIHLTASAGKGIELKCKCTSNGVDCTKCLSTSSKIEVLVTPFERITLLSLTNPMLICLAPERGFTVRDFNSGQADFFIRLYSAGILLTEVVKSLQEAGIDTTSYDTQQILEAANDEMLFNASRAVRYSIKHFKSCNSNKLISCDLLLGNILKAGSTFQVHNQMSGWSLHDQMKFMCYLSSVQELSSNSLDEVQTNVWEGYQAQEKLKSEQAYQQLLAEEKLLSQSSSSTTTTTTTTTTTQTKKKKTNGKQQAPQSKQKAQQPQAPQSKQKDTQAPAATVQKKTVPVNPYLSLEQRLNASQGKGRLACAIRVLRWRNVPLEKISAFVDQKQGNLVQQYASCTKEELKYHQQAHDIPMERILSIAELRDKYSFSYIFNGEGGCQRTGRCFYAQMKAGKGTETGIIRVGMDGKTREIYHIMFEKRDRIDLSELTREIARPEEVAEASDGWEQNSKYLFRFEGEAIVISVQDMKSKQMTTHRILPLS